ncbi:rhodanese-like domain-containing protein [Jiulongibacter sediminis]|uniref:NADH oxidase n=1 Tax=Jiulongibacter sediminis TaxID=1605367 RepID=A0A0P7C3V3_9BACT|nr:rhodanese-like domain-containing protein [Jiulongibacter sediminis]KPM49320.1 NADH oxidase [Jiulongibacter sediminis]TBX26371.1 NADH oxidase [Jiulongibacter sediminis]
MENKDITAGELKDLLDSGAEINFIDVRNQDEYDEDNLGAKLIPLGEFVERVDELDGLQDEDIYIHCRSGARSGRAKDYLESQGFNKVHNVLGGIMAFRALD